MTEIKMGTPIRIKPGLRNRPSISGREGTVVELVNDRLRVNVAGNQWVVERNEVIQL
jgi:membrane protein implicated in regulation of membrane protease activity